MLLFYFLTILIAIQSLYALWWLWTMGATRRRKKNTQQTPPVSVLICARNEAHQLQRFLPAVLEQDYPNFEVIVVNDGSADHTLSVLQQLAEQYPQLKIVDIAADAERLIPGKKFALQHAVAAASYDLLLMTDADCRPASAHWISRMTAPFSSGKELVAGYGAYSPARGLLNRFIRWETLHTFIQYSAYANSGLPYMATGRNLACKKSLLLQAQQSQRWALLPSGDDDLLIRETATRRNMAIVAHPDAFTCSEAKSDYAAWLHQKQRHVSTGKLYRPLQRYLLGLYGLSHGLMWLSFLVLQFTDYGHLAWLLMLLRCVLAWGLWSAAAGDMRERSLALYFPLCDIGWACYNFVLSPYILFKTKQQWK